MEKIGRSLHIGCGPHEKMADVGIDILAGPAVDIVHDLNEIPWPLAEESFDLILCYDVLEHLNDIVATMEEIYRVARNEALIKIHVPTGTSPDLLIDPT